MWRVPYFLIQLYRRIISPLLPATCRFHPSCSVYAAQAFRAHGLIAGAGYAIRRILRCHPWNPGGHDPVPPHRDFAPDDISRLNGEPDNG